MNRVRRMKKIVIEDREYEIIKNFNNAFDLDEFKERFTDYFYDFDYIVGDYSYEKLRLKGFYDSKNKKVRSINNAKDIEKYISDYCNYNAKHFILKKQKKR